MVREITIPGKPIGKGRPRFTRSGRAYTPKSTADYEKKVQQIYLKKYGEKSQLSGACRIIINAYYSVSKSDKKSVRLEKLQNRILPTVKPDVDNLAKVIMDSLNGLAYVDDKQVAVMTVEKRYAEEPYVHVLVMEFRGGFV